MTTTKELFLSLKLGVTGASVKMLEYFDIYDQIFPSIKDQKISLLEIGVRKGGSLWIWEQYFKNAKIYGIDIDESCKNLEFVSDRVKVMIGSEDDPVFLNSVTKETGPLDVIIDDGSHLSEHHIKSFMYLSPALKDGGIYIIEDMYTEHMPEFKTEQRFMEYLKGITELAIDNKIVPSQMWCPIQIRSMTFMDGLVIIQKGSRSRTKVEVGHR